MVNFGDFAHQHANEQRQNYISMNKHSLHESFAFIFEQLWVTLNFDDSKETDVLQQKLRFPQMFQQFKLLLGKKTNHWNYIP